MPSNNRFNFTKKKLDSLPIPDKGNRPYYHDTEVNGLSLRVTDKGVKSFIVQRRVNKKVAKVTLGQYPNMTIPRARNEATKALALISDGVNPNLQKKSNSSEDITLSRLFSDYMQSHSSNLKDNTIKDYNSVISNYFSDWLDIPIAKITRSMVESRHREITQRYPSRANTAMRHLRAYFKYAIGAYEGANNEPLFSHNPVDILNHNKSWNRESRRKDALKEHQFKPWYQAVQELPDANHKKPNQSETVRDLLVFVLFTGLRRREASNLRWTDIDFQDKSFVISNTKNYETHTLPLTKFLMDILNRRKTQTDSPFVFEGMSPDKPIDDPKRQVAKVRGNCGIYFTIHGLRRTFATIADRLNMSQYALKKLLNHKNDRDVTSGYIVTDVERLREPMNQITNHILERIK